MTLDAKTIGQVLELAKLGAELVSKYRRKPALDLGEDEFVNTLAEVRAAFKGIEVPAPYNPTRESPANEGPDEVGGGFTEGE